MPQIEVGLATRGPQAITLSHLQAAFFLLVLGIMLAVLTFLLESFFDHLAVNYKFLKQCNFDESKK